MEELVLVIVLVPMELTEQDTQSHDAVVYAAKGLVVSGICARLHEGRHVDDLQRTVARVRVYRVALIAAHGLSSPARRPNDDLHRLRLMVRLARPSSCEVRTTLREKRAQPFLTLWLTRARDDRLALNCQLCFEGRLVGRVEKAL